MLDLMYITNNTNVAKVAEKNGVDKIWIDLETLGKEERQKGMNTVKSKHSIDDISKVKKVLTTSKLLVRVNPINPNSKNEIEKVISAGADIIMLPFWKSVDEVKCFLNIVNKRVKTMLLLETKEAVECLPEIVALGGFDSIHIGLNDLHLSYGLNFMFELLANGVVEKICNYLRIYNIDYGFGGIADIGNGELPAEKIILEHIRLKSNRAILSRSFCDFSKYNDIEKFDYDFTNNMKRLISYFEAIDYNDSKMFEENRKEIVDIVNKKVNVNYEY